MKKFGQRNKSGRFSPGASLSMVRSQRRRRQRQQEGSVASSIQSTASSARKEDATKKSMKKSLIHRGIRKITKQRNKSKIRTASSKESTFSDHDSNKSADSTLTDLYLSGLSPLDTTETTEEVLDQSDEVQCYQSQEIKIVKSSKFSSNLSTLLCHRSFLSSKDKQAMEEDLNVDFAETLLAHQEQIDAHGFSVESHLVAANHLLQQFFSVLEEIRNLSYMPATTEDIVFEVLESFLYLRVSNLFIAMMESLNAEEIASAVSFIENFCESIAKSLPEAEMNPQWRQDQETLFAQYLELAAEKEMKELLDNCFEQQTPEEIQEDRNGHLITGLPQDVGSLFYQQIKVAKDGLPERYLEQVVAVCNQQLTACVADTQLKIGSGWKEMRTSMFCAMINDAKQLAEQCEERNEEFLIDSEEYVEQGESTVTDLLELSLLGVHYLSERIMHTLCDPENPILTTVGDKIWEMDQKCIAIERTVATLKDYFEDLRDWLASDYYFTKVLKQTFDLTIQIYLESFFGNTLIDGVQSAQDAAEEMKQDHLRLTIFFNGANFEQYHEHTKNGFYAQRQVNDELLILLNIANILNPENEPDMITSDIAAVVERFPEKDGGQAAVLHLAGLRKRHRAAESFAWIKAIASAQKRIESDSSEEMTPRAVVQVLPDLRNSPFIANVQALPKSTMERKLSNSTVVHANTTVQLLEVRQRAVVSPFGPTSSIFATNISETVKTMDGRRLKGAMDGRRLREAYDQTGNMFKSGVFRPGMFGTV